MLEKNEEIKIVSVMWHVRQVSVAIRAQQPISYSPCAFNERQSSKYVAPNDTRNRRYLSRYKDFMRAPGLVASWHFTMEWMKYDIDFPSKKRIAHAPHRHWLEVKINEGIWARPNIFDSMLLFDNKKPPSTRIVYFEFNFVTLTSGWQFFRDFSPLLFFFLLGINAEG